MIDFKDARMYVLIAVTSILFTFADGVKAALDGVDVTTLTDQQLVDLVVNTGVAAIRTGVGAAIYAMWPRRS